MDAELTERGKNCVWTMIISDRQRFNKLQNSNKFQYYSPSRSPSLSSIVLFKICKKNLVEWGQVRQKLPPTLQQQTVWPTVSATLFSARMIFCGDLCQLVTPYAKFRSRRRPPGELEYTVIVLIARGISNLAKLKQASIKFTNSRWYRSVPLE